VLGLLTSSAVLASDMPRALAWPLAPGALVHGLWLARRELRRPTRDWVLPAVGLPTLDNEAMAQVEVRWRGPIAFLAWRAPDGHRRHLQWWPDVLPPSRRRELRLVLQVREGRAARDAQPAASMAP